MTSEPTRHLRPRPGPGPRLEITPASIDWRYVSTSVVDLAAGQVHRGDTGPDEVAIVPLSGTARFEFAGQSHLVSRRDVFSDLPHVAYLPPRTAWSITAVERFEFALGGVPADGLLPPRLIRPDELPTSIRGGANVSRGVTGTLDLSLPAERLLAFEIVTPSGNWSSWPPHLHDGTNGSSYQEETYYFRMQPPDGFAIQRIYAPDGRFDVSIRAGDGDLILVHEGFHTVVSAPGTNTYYLNFMGGDVRPVNQYIDPAYAWVASDWAGNPTPIPVSAESSESPTKAG